jgi:hypothetical protein
MTAAHGEHIKCCIKLPPLQVPAQIWIPYRETGVSKKKPGKQKEVHIDPQRLLHENMILSFAQEALLDVQILLLSVC